MDRGLTDAVSQFVETVTEVLIEAAQATGVDDSTMERNALVEAMNLCVAMIDADERHAEDELWTLIAAFAPYDMFADGTTPQAIRDADLLKHKANFLNRRSEVFETLLAVDTRSGSALAKIYYDQAMNLVHVMASVDQYVANAELVAIVKIRNLMLEGLPAAKPQISTVDDRDPSRPMASTATKAAEEVLSEEVDLDTPPEPLEDVLAELDELIGLDAVKEEVKLLSALLKVQALRAERGLAVVENTRHLIFSGNPGTGKTTVGRLLARIYKSLGALDKGHLVEVDRSGLVGRFVGHTGPKVAEVFESADGGILLIDEAYSLTRGGEKDFGREAIDAIVKQVEDRRETMAVILAGYPDEMKDLVASNPGFSSRFPKTIQFPDYADEELVKILVLIAGSDDYTLTDEASEAATEWFAATPRGHGFGNGRLARNLYEAAVSRHAMRLVDTDDPTDEDLATLQAVDITSVPVKNPRG